MAYDHNTGSQASGNVNQTAENAADHAQLALAQAQQAAPAAGAQRVTPGPDGVVQLPAGTQIDNVRAEGRDLVIQLPNGQVLIVVDGAVLVPLLVVGGVQIPPQTLAQLLIGAEPEPAAGALSSSGGNFSVPLGDIGPGIGIGDLLPPTNLAFAPPEFEELGQELDEEPTVIIITPDNPAGAPTGNVQTSDAGLPARPVTEPAGTQAGSGLNVTSGFIVYTPGDEPSTVTINGMPVMVGQVIESPHGFLTITSVEPGRIGYTFTQTDNVLHPAGANDAVEEIFDVVVTDADGDTASGELIITILDDQPIARPDTDIVASGSFGPATGNVITDAAPGDAGDADAGADTVGADGAVVTQIASNNVPANVDTTLAGGVFVVNGQYGVLTIAPNGDYSYVRSAGTPGGVNDVFTYTLTDGDADAVTSTLTISIGDATPVTGPNAAVQLDDETRPGGIEGGVGDVSPNTANLTGNLAASGGDGALTYGFALTGAPAGFTYVASGSSVLIQQGGVTVITVTLNTATGAYTVTHNNPIQHPAGGNENDVAFTLTYNVTDVDGDAAVTPGTLTINVDDDTPTLATVALSGTVDEDGLAGGIAGGAGDVTGEAVAATGNVASLFNSGADTPLTYSLAASTAGLPALTSGGLAVTYAVNGNTLTASTTAGTVFTLVLNPTTGAYTFTLVDQLDHAPGAGENDLTIQLGSMIVATDRDGDSVTASAGALTITVDDDTPVATQSVVAGTVDEDGVTSGRAGGTGDVAGEVVTASGSVASMFSSGADAPLTFSLGATGGLPALTSNGVPVTYSVNGSTLTASAGGNTVFTLTLTANGTYTFTLVDQLDHAAGQDENDLVLNLGSVIQATDADGDTVAGAASGLQITVDDDTPLASADTNAGAEGADLSGNVLTNDASGADAPISIVGVRAAGGDTATAASGGVGVQVAGLYGTLTLQANGSYTYDGTPNTVPPAGATEVFVYTIVDADGDPSTTTLTINLTNSTIIATNDDISVNEAALPVIGSNPGSNAETATGTLADNVSDGTGPYTFALVGSGDGTYGTLTLNPDGTYSYTLDTPFDTTPDANNGTNVENNRETFTYQVTDANGNTTTSTITVDIVDDVPSITANGAIPSLTVDETTLATNATASFAGIFAAVGGADGAASTTYALNIVAGPSGLVDTATGQAVNLVMNGGVVEGRTAGSNELVFTVSVDGSGNVTLDQLRAVAHDVDGSSAAAHDDPKTLSAATLVTLTATVTDGDGDTASATANIGQNLVFEDDGPSLSASTTQPTLVVDETTLAVNASASFAGIFTHTYGADGAGSVGGYALGINPGASGLVDTATGLPVVLTLEGGQVVGRAGAAGPVVFTVSVDGAGIVTLDQVRAVVHADPTNPDDSATLAADNLITLTATVTDGDGDTATATANIGQNLTFEDDGPSVSASTTQPTLVVDETNLGVNASANFATVFTSTFGADGLANAGFALGINPGASGLVDTATGLPVVLTLEGGQVVGRAGPAGPVVFTVSVDGGGLVTLDQVRAVVHANPANPDDSATLAADNLITLTATVTDRDGDTATATANIGQNLVFEDDGPSISASSTQPTLTVDETTLAVNATASFASVFTSAFGADGAGTVTYGLNIVAGPSGLVDVATGQAVNLVMNGGVVEGRTAGSNELVFTVSVDGSGNVTLDQIRAVQHANPADSNDSRTLSADNLVTLTATVTDGDGDTATATANIGQNLAFLDDGPSISASSTQPTLTVDETTLAVNATASFASVFTSAFGADGAGTVTYGLNIVAGPSGLVDVATGQAVNLVMNGGVVEGRTAGSNELVFTVSVDGSGNVTLDQIRAVQHANPADSNDSRTLSADNLVTLTATVTDRDGDTATATANIGQNLAFLDDGPSISASSTQPTLTVDETTLAVNASASFASVFTSAFGADGAGTVTYGLNIVAGPSGLVDVATGQAVNLVLNGGVVEGRTAGSNELVFTVSVDGSGNVTLDQIRAVQHANANDPNDSATLSADNLVTLTATATDRDGDTATATANIGQNLVFLDDGPSVFTPASAVLLNQADATVTRNLDVDGNINNNVGADQLGAVRFANISNGQDSGLTSGDDPVTYWLSNDGQTLQGRTGSTNGSDGTLIFEIDLDQGAGTYTVTMSGVIDNGAGISFDNLTSTNAGNANFRGVGADDPLTTVDLLLSGSAGGADATVNTDSDSIGTANQSMDAGETLRIDFVSGLTSGAATPTGFGYTGHVSTSSFIGLIPQVQGNQAQTVSFKVWALDSTVTQSAAPDRTNAFSDGTPTIITEVTVKDYLSGATTSLDISGLANGATMAVGYGISVTRNADGSVTFSGVQEGDSYGFSTGAGDFNAVVVQAQGSFDLGVFAIGAVDSGDPINLSYDLQLTDADGDSVVVPGALDITLNPEAGAPQPLLAQGSGDGKISSSPDTYEAWAYDDAAPAPQTQTMEFAWRPSGSLLDAYRDGGSFGQNLANGLLAASLVASASVTHDEPASFQETYEAPELVTFSAPTAPFSLSSMVLDAANDGFEPTVMSAGLLDAGIPMSSLDSLGAQPQLHGMDVAEHLQPGSQAMALLDGADSVLTQVQAPLFLDGGVLPVFDASALLAAQAGPAGQPQLVASVLADALNGGAEAGPDIDSLLAGLPGAAPAGGEMLQMADARGADSLVLTPMVFDLNYLTVIDQG